MVKAKKPLKKTGRGRPRKTLDDLPRNWKAIILKMAEEGCSEVEMRVAICGSSERLWYALKRREEEFRQTVKRTKIICQAWWERSGREGLKWEKFHTALWFINMKNRFPNAWKDKQEIKHTGQVNIANQIRQVLEGKK